MKIISYNIRGFRGLVKNKEIRASVFKKHDLVHIQETKFVVINRSNVKFLLNQKKEEKRDRNAEN